MDTVSTSSPPPATSEIAALTHTPVFNEPFNSTPNQEARSVQPVREIDSRELMAGQREIMIRHGGELYRLSVTRNGKLILRK